MVRAAQDGDRTALRHAVATAEAVGDLKEPDVVNTARAVLERELEGAKGERDAIARIDEVRSCAFAITGALESRAERDDESSGEAAFELLEAGELPGSLVRHHRGSSDDRWRAVVMWGQTAGADHDVRWQGLKDGSPLVRRAALHAIAERNDGSDFDVVLEAARLDPDPMLRTRAVRALARLGNPPASLVTSLQDLWTDADGPLREDIARAYASPAILRHGGLDALQRALAGSTGDDAVGVASVILGARIGDPGLHTAAVSALWTAIETRRGRARAHAIAVAPLADARLREAMKHASEDDDTTARVGALGRLADPRERDVPAEVRDHARDQLEALAGPGAPYGVASRARLLLAEAKDFRVQAWLEDDLRNERPEVRLSAVLALAALGRAGRGAPLLADEDVSVRTRAACTIVVASPR